MYEELIKELRSYYRAYVSCGDKKSRIAKILGEAADAIEALVKINKDLDPCYMAYRFGAGCSDCDDYFKCEDRLIKYLKGENDED